MDLRCASVVDLPEFREPFDKVLAVNSLQFWPEPVRALQAVRQQMGRGGRIVLVIQPRSPRATSATSLETGAMLRRVLTQAGFVGVREEYNEALQPVPAAAAVGTMPD